MDPREKRSQDLASGTGVAPRARDINGDPPKRQEETCRHLTVTGRRVEDCSYSLRFKRGAESDYVTTVTCVIDS